MADDIVPSKPGGSGEGDETSTVPWGLIMDRLPEVIREMNKQSEEAARRQAEIWLASRKQEIDAQAAITTVKETNEHDEAIRSMEEDAKENHREFLKAIVILVAGAVTAIVLAINNKTELILPLLALVVTATVRMGRRKPDGDGKHDAS